ncbi:TPA: hypothetical protein DEX28_00790 [Patescibacteria group bacterium]|nr:hypothetical protein [Patescibacteria group bacterium]
MLALSLSKGHPRHFSPSADGFGFTNINLKNKSSPDIVRADMVLSSARVLRPAPRPKVFYRQTPGLGMMA